jgi:hypothetical protein
VKLSELRELREAATPGPWREVPGGFIYAGDSTIASYIGDTPTARLITLAPDLARLVEELGELAEAVEQCGPELTEAGFGYLVSMAQETRAKLEALE